MKVLRCPFQASPSELRIGNVYRHELLVEKGGGWNLNEKIVRINFYEVFNTKKPILARALLSLLFGLLWMQL